MKFLIWGAAILLAVAGLFFGYLYTVMAEPDDLALNGWTTGLYVPAEIRQLPTDGACGPVTVSRNWLECGGICGVAYDIAFPSTDSVEVIDASMKTYFDTALPDHTVNVREANYANSRECRKILVEVVKDSRYSK